MPKEWELFYSQKAMPFEISLLKKKEMKENDEEGRTPSFEKNGILRKRKVQIVLC